VIVVELHDERFQKLVIEVADPANEIAKLKQAMGPSGVTCSRAEISMRALASRAHKGGGGNLPTYVSGSLNACP
jgi:hypothetical protein